MGKDGSGEPAAKKFKQSQLCFKSPKATNNNLKNKSLCSKELDGNDTPCKNSKENLSVKIDDNKSNNVSNIKDEIIVIDSDCHDMKENIESLNTDLNKTEAENKNEKSIETKNNKNACEKENLVKKSLEYNCATNVNSLISSEKSQTTLKTVKLCEKISLAKTSPKKTNDTSVVENLDESINSVKKSEKNITEINNDNFESSVEVPGIEKSDKGDTSLGKISSASINDVTVSPSKSVISLSSNSEDENNTSLSSTPTTPKTSVSLASQKTPKQMTPKMLQRHEESLKKKQLQQQLKQEKLELKEKMKNERLKQKEEEEEKRRQLKEERKKKRLAEIELKNEEKRLKKEDKRLKKELEEEEKRKKKEQEEEEKRKKKEQKEEELRKEERKKEEEKQRQERAQAAFVSFFKKQSSSSSKPGQVLGTPMDDDQSTPNVTPDSATTFMPFPVKNDMRLATICRRQLSPSSKEQLESYLDKEQGTNVSYLNDIKNETYTPGTSARTWPPIKSEDLHDCIVIEAQVDDAEGVENNVQPLPDSNNQTRRAKLFQFCENRRPAYFGTWTKQSKDISGRRPLGKDTKGILDYEVDSDSDWEEEEEGEDLETLKDDENEKEEEVVGGENGYELDNTFVPHGYLSDEEQPEDEELLQESVEKQKDRLVALKEEFDEEMKQGGAQALKPKLLGCLWVSNSTTEVSKGSLYEVLLNHRAVWDESNCVSIDVKEDIPVAQEKSPQQTPSSKQLPHIVLQEIARMVDGCRWPFKKIIKEVSEVVAMARPQNPVSKLAISRAIKNMASKTLDSKESSVWTVKQEFRSGFGLEELEETPVQINPEIKVKSKETLLDSFLKGQQPTPQAKKRISLTPVTTPKQQPSNVKTELTPELAKKTSETVTTKKKVAFVTLPPRTPSSTPQNSKIPRTPGPWTSKGQMSIKPHVDTPRPPTNKFLNKDSPPSSEIISISDDSNL